MAVNNNVRVRFAPSPTGFLHVGGLRTALFNFLFARKNGGKFILRIEDTDKAREVPGALEDIVATLKDFGLNFDEGPLKQSDRLEIYRKYADELLAKGAAYKCYCSAERIEQMKKNAEAAKMPFKYDKHCLKNPSPALRASSPARGEEGRFVVRQNVPEEGSTEFEDLVHGKIKIENRQLDDGILMRSNGTPVYNFANVIDDHLMNITHVIRGEEFISSTPKFVLLYQALGWQPPKFVHLPLILDPSRKKLSKRFGDVSVKEYMEKGYLKEALTNFVALLGWNPKTTQEIFSVDELVSEFSLDKVNKAGAVFDVEKLDFVNRQWQRRLNLGALDPMYQRAKYLLEGKFGKGAGEILPAIWPLVLERVKGPSELSDRLPEFYFFFEEPEYETELLVWKDVSPDRIRKNLQELRAFLERKKGDEDGIKGFLAKKGIGTGEALWPLRVALSGLTNSPGPFDILAAFSGLPRGKEILMKRLDCAIEKLEKI